MNDESKRRVRILLVDDHPSVRFGMRQIIETAHELSVSGEADTRESAPQAARMSVADADGAHYRGCDDPLNRGPLLYARGGLPAPQVLTFQGLKALSSSSPSIANATDGKCREMTDFIEFSSTHSIPSFV